MHSILCAFTIVDHNNQRASGHTQVIIVRGSGLFGYSVGSPVASIELADSLLA